MVASKMRCAHANLHSLRTWPSLGEKRALADLIKCLEIILDYPTDPKLNDRCPHERHTEEERCTWRQRLEWGGRSSENTGSRTTGRSASPPEPSEEAPACRAAACLLAPDLRRVNGRCSKSPGLSRQPRGLMAALPHPQLQREVFDLLTVHVRPLEAM